ncbi:ARP6_2 [Sanghuangporus weigelae]
MQPTPVVVLDTIKAGNVVPGGQEEPLAEARLKAATLIPTIWDELFHAKDGLRVNTSDTSLLITEPYFNLLNIQDRYDQFVFKEYGFHSCYRWRPASLLPYGSLFSSEASGHSRTQDDRAPLLRVHKFREDVELSRSNPSKIVQEYIFPRYSENRPGRLKTQEDVLIGEDDVLRMNTERFAVGGGLQFRPSDDRTSHTVADVISSLPEDMQELFWTNVGFIGGNVRLSGFRNRLMTELRSLAPAEHEVRIYESSKKVPIIAAYLARAESVLQPEFANVCVTRAEYQEAGSHTYRRKFKYATWQVREVGERTPQGPGKDTGNNAGLARSRTRSRESKTQGDVGDSRAERKLSRSSRSRAANNKALYFVIRDVFMITILLFRSVHAGAFD